MVHTMKTAAGITGAPRRQHEKSFKAELVEQCLAPGASVAAVALSGGINANLLFKWRRDHRERPGVPPCLPGIGA
jgi:transposase